MSPVSIITPGGSGGGTVSESTAITYGADSTGVASSTAAFQAMLNAGDLVLSSGTYRVGFVTYEGNQNRTIRVLPGHKVTIIQTDMQGVFSLRGGWDNFGAISSFADGTMNGNDDGTTTTTVTILTMPGSNSVVKGDIVKVVSDDRPYGFDNTAQTGYQTRRGEYNMVGLTSNTTTISLSSKLVDTYTTSPRVGRLWNVTFKVLGDITFTSDASLLSQTGYTAALILRAAKYCVVDGVTFDGIPGRAIANHTFASSFKNIRFKNLSNRPSKSHFGYGVADGGAHTRVHDCHGENVRHVVSENTEGQNPASTNYEYHGGGWWGLVTDCTGTHCQAAPFDTHETAYGYTFDSCKAVGTFLGASSSGGGITLRGRMGTARNCDIDGCVYGINVAVMNGALLENNKVTRPTFTALLLGTGNSGDASITQQNDVTIRGGYYEGTNLGTSRPFVISSGSLPPIAEISGVTFALIGSGSGSRMLDLYTACRLSFYDCIFDYSKFTNASAGLSIFTINDSSQMFLNFYRPKIRIGSTITSSVQIGSATATNTSRVRIYDYEYEAWNASAQGLNKAIGNVADGKYSGTERYGTSWFQKNKTNGLAITAAASASLAGIGNLLDNEIFVRFTGTAGDVTVGSIPNAELQGQAVTFINESNGIVSITGQTPTIAAGASKRFVWGLGTAAWHVVA